MSWDCDFNLYYMGLTENDALYSVPRKRLCEGLVASDFNTFELFALVTDGVLENAGWEYQNAEMKQLSELFPNILFTVRKQEPNGDLFQTYYHNGKMQEEEAQVSFAAYNLDKMK